MIHLLCYPGVLTVRLRAVFVISAAFLLFIVISCSSRRVPSLTALSQKYRPTRIATNIQARPGSFAWANDGRTLAFLKDGTVNLYDADSADVRSLGIRGAHSVSWSPADALLVLASENGKKILCTIDRKSLEISRATIDADAESVYALDDNRHLLVLSKRVSRLSFGTRVAVQVFLSGKEGALPKKLYEFSKIYPMDKPDQLAMSAWSHAGLRPVDNSLLAIECIKPPDVAPYSRVIMIDIVKGDITEISGRTHNAIYVSASWSPDGAMIALTTGDGGIDIRAVRTNRPVLNLQIPGFYPSWSPKGDKVYTGGHLIPLDGQGPEVLLLNAEWSISAWSSDGTMIAVSAEGDLWLFRGMSQSNDRSSSKPDRMLLKKMQELQDLYRDGLVSSLEYQDGKDKLFNRTHGE